MVFILYFFYLRKVSFLLGCDRTQTSETAAPSIGVELYVHCGKSLDSSPISLQTPAEPPATAAAAALRQRRLAATAKSLEPQQAIRGGSSLGATYSDLLTQIRIEAAPRGPLEGLQLCSRRQRSLLVASAPAAAAVSTASAASERLWGPLIVQEAPSLRRAPALKLGGPPMGLAKPTPRDQGPPGRLPGPLKRRWGAPRRLRASCG